MDTHYQTLEDEYHVVFGETNPLAVYEVKRKVRRILPGTGGRLESEYTTPRAVKLRSRLLTRQNGCCYFCKLRISVRQATIDHLVPRAKGGKNRESNLAAACFKCNNEKGSLSVAEYMLVLQSRSLSLVSDGAGI
jgi:5-methylcytosine-specific restriction endonuclease McrA